MNALTIQYKGRKFNPKIFLNMKFGTQNNQNQPKIFAKPDFLIRNEQHKSIFIQNQTPDNAKNQEDLLYRNISVISNQNIMNKANQYKTFREEFKDKIKQIQKLDSKQKSTHYNSNNKNMTEDLRFPHYKSTLIKTQSRVIQKNSKSLINGTIRKNRPQLSQGLPYQTAIVLNDLNKLQKSNIFMFDLKIGKCPNYEYIPKKKPKSAINLKRDPSTPHNPEKKPYVLHKVISTQFEQKLTKYLQFLFLVNLSNRICRNLEAEYEKPLKYVIERGNNQQLIRKIIKKRFWWQQCNSTNQAKFIWSQSKKSQIHKKQTQSNFTFCSFPILPKKQKQDSSQSTKQQNKIIHKILNCQDWQFLKYTLAQQKETYIQKCKKLHKFLNIKLENQNAIVTNHLPIHDILSNKKSLYQSLKFYYDIKNENLWNIIPETYHLTDTKNQEFQRFQSAFHKNISKIWILKPGEYTNRGTGIILSKSLQQIKNLVNDRMTNQESHTFIVQHYIASPFLYHRRKFDIRTYILVTINNGIIKGYWYNEGYIRTSSTIYQTQQLQDTYTHLTNDAVQKYSDNYGKYQTGNKITYSQFQRYLDNLNSPHNFQKDIHPKLKNIAYECLMSTNIFLDKNKKEHNFQIFGLDYIIDSNFKPYLLQINTNPCLQTSCPILQRIIPIMVQNAFRLGLDPIYPPPKKIPPSKYYNISQNAIIHNNFELIFDEIIDKKKIDKIFFNKTKQLEDISIRASQSLIIKTIDPPEINLIAQQDNYYKSTSVNY